MSKFAGMQLHVDKPGRMEIVHPVSRQPLREKGEDAKPGVVAYIDLHSADSPIAKAHQQQVLKRRLNMRRGAKLTAEEIEAEAVEHLCAITTGWYLLDLEGHPLGVEYSTDNARDLYTEPALAWLREQVDEYVVDRGNFSKASSIS